VAQLEANLGAVRLELTAEESARLDAISAPTLPDYPHGFISRASAARMEALDAPGGAT
jgi:hypothetical protein